MVCICPPSDQPRVIAAAFAGDRKDVPMIRLPQTFMSPDDDRIVAIEVAESAPAGLAGSVSPRPFSTPAERGALALIGRNPLAAKLRVVRLPHGGTTRVDRNLPP